MRHFYDYLDKRVIKKMKGKRIAFRRVLDGLTSGLHGSATKGYNIEFSQHRNYFQGDDLKNIDWRLYGRREKMYVKEYEEDTNFKAFFLLDVSSSMDFGSESTDEFLMTKLEYSKRIISHLAYFFLKQKDQVGLGFFDAKLKEIHLPKAGDARIHYLIEKMKNVTNGKFTDFEKSIRKLLTLIRKRSILFIISDFITEEFDLFNTLDVFQKRKMPVIALKINDKVEADFTFGKYRMFTDPESGETIKAYPKDIRNLYLKEYKNHEEIIASKCKKRNIYYEKILTSDYLEEIILKILNKMSR